MFNFLPLSRPHPFATNKKKTFFRFAYPGNFRRDGKNEEGKSFSISSSPLIVRISWAANFNKRKKKKLEMQEQKKNQINSCHDLNSNEFVIIIKNRS